MVKLNTLAQRLADEIRAQEWSDVHSRADGSRHDRKMDRTSSLQLSDGETDVVRLNVVWVVGQALAEDDPNFDIRAFAEAAGVPDRQLYTRSGKPNRGIEAGIRPTERQQQDSSPTWL